MNPPFFHVISFTKRHANVKLIIKVIFLSSGGYKYIRADEL